MLVNKECSSWYNRVGKFLLLSLQTNPIQTVRPMAHSAVMVECE